MQVIIEYRGKWLEWCICSSLQGDVLLDGFETGFDVIADHVEQYLQARSFVATLKFVG